MSSNTKCNSLTVYNSDTIHYTKQYISMTEFFIINGDWKLIYQLTDRETKPKWLHHIMLWMPTETQNNN